ncbi:vWA domain-containing protein [Nitratireductor indicus]|uniref:vWA domain-containing protein n=1 Tax=Nitratireductor indicus TaxID=721133 RepID=UPI002874D0F9|nr:VWA domain-containing protein [Nitratireductor indicus]MDS1136661.1 VWA domain-containing protein [Nitratireductor indicus]
MRCFLKQRQAGGSSGREHPICVAVAGLAPLALAAALSAAHPARAAESDHAAVLVLDASGSMWGQIAGGQTKIEVARDVLGDFLALRDPQVPLGFIAYGHNRKGDCSDIEVIAPTGIQRGGGLATRLNGISPKGKTPLGQSLRLAAGQIPRTAESADIVLVTDGLETCGVDPCAVAEELMAEGIRIRAHVVGFGLTEQEAQSLSCVPEKTGGLLLRPQSGDELAEALTRTAERVERQPAVPGKAVLNLAIKADVAGRPDAVEWHARNLASGEERKLGRLVFDGSRTALPVELEAGPWLIRAEAGEAGRGEIELTVAASDSRTVYVPFIGAYPEISLSDRGPYTADMSIALPYEVTREGLAKGGADFLIYQLEPGQKDLGKALTWTYVEGTLGRKLAALQLVGGPGRYTLAFARSGETDIANVQARFDIEVEARPAVSLEAPAAINPGMAIPVSARGAHYYLDRIELHRDGQAVSYDHSRTLQDLYWPDGSNTLKAPAEVGHYELVYIRNDAAGGDAEIVARVPIEVREGDLYREERERPTSGAHQKAEAGGDGMGHGPDDFLAAEDVGFRCDKRTACQIRDAETGLSFVLPAGWFTDIPVFGGRTAGQAQAGEMLPFPSISFFSAAEVPDTIVLNPHQWLRMNGPCEPINVGELCMFESANPEASTAFELLIATLSWDGIRPGVVQVPPSDAPPETLQQCGTRQECPFFEAETGLGGTLPPGWAVDVSTLAVDGRSRATWFSYKRDGVEKYMALNQDGNDPGINCAATGAGRLCEFSETITPREKNTLVETLYRKPVGGG